MKLLFVSSEVTPFCKTGGLADVAGSLPQALAKTGADVRVMVPLYQMVDQKWRREMEFICSTTIRLSWRSQYCGVFMLKKDGVTYYFLDNTYYFDRTDLYGHYDDGERYAFFSKACLDILPKIDFYPDVIHANDWQCALIPVFLKLSYQWNPSYATIKTMFTIHNIQYQGRFRRDFLSDVCGLSDEWFTNGLLAYDDGICLMKGAIYCADRVTTVSRTYADEIRTAYYGHGLDAVLRDCAAKVTGVVNGIDAESINPAVDPFLAKNFTVDTMTDKAFNKADLQKEVGLPIRDDVPLIAIVSRLAGHKGMDLIAAVAEDLMGEDIQLVVLGKGEYTFEQLFLYLNEKYPEKCSANILFSASLANKIYGGADLFLMPSQSEPCGLSQMMAMRYGTVPIVRETGGLKDTVPAYNEYTGEGLGFSFANYNAHEMLETIRYALRIYKDKDAWQSIMKRDMTQDFSWLRSAGEYGALYESMCKER